MPSVLVVPSVLISKWIWPRHNSDDDDDSYSTQNSDGPNNRQTGSVL